MKTILLIIALALASVCLNCGFGGKTEIAKDDGSIQMGDLVLAPDNLLVTDGKVRFDPMMEAVVGRIEGGKATVHYLKSIYEGTTYNFDSANKKAEYDLADLIKVPSIAEPSDSFKPGDKIYALSNYQTGVDWKAAEIVRVDKNMIEAIYSSYGKQSVTLSNAFVPLNNMSRIIRLPDNFLAKVETATQKGDFYGESRKHQLAILEDYQPNVGDEVLSHSDIGIVTAKVTAVSKPAPPSGTGTPRNPTTVKFHPSVWTSFNSVGGFRNDRSDYYVPLSALQSPPAVSVGQYVAVRTDPPAVWKYAIVTAVNGDDLEVKVDGVTTQTIHKGDYYPLK